MFPLLDAVLDDVFLKNDDVSDTAAPRLLAEDASPVPSPLERPLCMVFVRKGNPIEMRFVRKNEGGNIPQIVFPKRVK